ncbi:MAG: OmpA family protein [Pseudomonadota bacterium]
MSSVSDAEETRLHRSVRFWKLREQPTGWWPWGLLWLAGLLITFLVGALLTAPDIEATAQQSVATALERYDDVTVVADGQFIDITATAPAAERATIEAIARGAVCNSWVGELVCPIRVNVALNAPAAPPVEPRLHDFAMLRRGDGVRIAGEVADNTARDTLRRFADPDARPVGYEITVTSDPGMPMDETARQRGLQVLPLLETGDVTWTDGRFSVVGQTTADNATRIRSIVEDTASPLTLGRITLQVPEEVSRCNDTFAALLGETSIRFRTGSAAIDARSNALLEQLAAVAADCAGDLVVEGHTDSVGNEADNLTLSQRRADAVANALAQLGIDRTRITTQGFGEAAPIGDNNTATGRAQNRRIVIAVQALGQ